MDLPHSFIETYRTSPVLCDNLISYYKKNKEYRNVGVTGKGLMDKKKKDSMDVSFYNNSNNKFIVNFFKEISKHVSSYVNKYNIGNDVHTCQHNMVQHYGPGEVTQLYIMREGLKKCYQGNWFICYI